MPMGARGALPTRDLGGLIRAVVGAYRVAFVPFAAMWIVPGVVLVGAIALMMWASITATTAPAAAVPVLLLATYAVYGVAWCGTIYGVAQQQLGRPVMFSECYSRGLSRLLPLVGASILLGLAMVIPALLTYVVIGIPLFLFLMVRWMFFSQAVVVEGLGPVDALSKSWRLVREAWWRVFGILLVFYLILYALTIPPVFVGSVVPIVGFLAPAGLMPAVIVSALVIGVSLALLAPLPVIALTMLYLDLRVRKEGLTVDILAAELTT